MAWRTSRVAFADVVRLQDALECPEPLAWVLVRRGLGDPAAARAFLSSEGPLDPPEAIPGIPEAADRLAKAVRAGERIVVHGDYDCDGISSTAILVQALEGRGARVTAFLPSRFTDGYGVSVATVERLADEGCDLLVTVDCGTTAVEALTRAAELGIDSVVCDHHLAGGQRPPAIIANPALGRGSDALPAAAGVTFKLVQALASRLDGDRLAPAPEEGIDLVALATVADAVPLIGENRRLVARGLRALRANPRPGIAALCAAAKISPRGATARDLGWSLAPAINASGRMAHPERALQLLVAREGPGTTALAQELWALNMERRDVEQRVTAEAIEILEASPPEVREAHALVVAGEGWHEGVVGIVASRLVERFSRPAIVVSIAGDVAKGSGRSLPGVDLHSIVDAASGPLQRWGGHAGAVGLQLAPGDIATFRAGMSAAAESMQHAIERARIRTVDAVVGVRDLSLANGEAMEELQPFGTGNPEVRLAVPAALVDGAGTLGQERQHLQVRLRMGGAHSRAVGWRQGRRSESIDVGVRHDAIVQLGVERWQDLVGPKVTLEALEPVRAAPVARLCQTRCDRSCPDRVTFDSLAALASAEPSGPPAAGPGPAGVRDRRGLGAVLATLAALAGADRGVVAVVADTARRRTLLDAALAPGRFGVETAILGGRRCDVTALTHRLEASEGVPMIGMIEYATLAQVALPRDVHIALVDPPSHPAEAEWVRARAGGGWLHLLWGDEEIAFTRSVVEAEWNVREAAAAVWRAVADGAVREWGAALDDAIAGEGPAIRSPGSVARAVAALREIGRLELDDRGMRAVLDAPARTLAESATARAAEAALGERIAFLDRVGTLSFDVSAVSLMDVRAG